MVSGRCLNHHYVRRRLDTEEEEEGESLQSYPKAILQDNYRQQDRRAGQLVRRGQAEPHLGRGSSQWHEILATVVLSLSKPMVSVLDMCGFSS